MIIYTLECENNKYYVGKTKNLQRRWEQHQRDVGSAWTKKYRPIKIIDNFETIDSYDEDKQTIKMMEKYGIANVRGGTWSQLYLPKSDYGMLCKMITSQTDKCYKCNQKGHFIKDCPENLIVSDEQPVINNDPDDDESLLVSCAKLLTHCWDCYTFCFRRQNDNLYLELNTIN